MGVRGYKFDYAPLLPPGRHCLSLRRIAEICVSAFEENAWRRRLHLALEEFVFAFIQEHIRCDMLIGGSFLTAKPFPDDVDVAVELAFDLAEDLTPSQRRLVDTVNEEGYTDGIDGFVYTVFPRGHELFGHERLLGAVPEDGISWAEQYQLEHSGRWLKGVAVHRVLETDVGLRLCR